MILVTVTGHSCKITTADSARFTTSIPFVQYVFLSSCLLAIASFGQFTGTPFWEMRASAVFVGLLLPLAVTWLWIVAFNHFNMWRAEQGKLRWVLTPLGSVPAMLIFHAVAIWSLQVIDSTDDVYPMWTQGLLRNLAIVLILDFFFVRFVCPIILQEATPKPESTDIREYPLAEPPLFPSDTDMVDGLPTWADGRLDPQDTAAPPAEEVEINGVALALNGLQYIKSEDHKVRAIYDGQSDIVFRARLGDVADALGDGLGVRLNRSVWVPFNSIAGLERSGRDTTVVLLGGDRLKVSVARSVAVINAVELNAPGLSPLAQSATK